MRMILVTVFLLVATYGFDIELNRLHCRRFNQSSQIRHSSRIQAYLIRKPLTIPNLKQINEPPQCQKLERL